KLRNTRRIRWTVLLVPAMLMLIALSTRYLSHSMNLTPWQSSYRTTDFQALLFSKRDGNSSGSLPSIPASPPNLPSPFPQALDESLTTNFTTQLCVNFFTNMTASSAFRTCRPFSLLFQTSAAFIDQAQTNTTALNDILWGTCNTDTDAVTCSSNMAWFADNIQQSCAEDMKANNALVRQTLSGLQTYDLYRSVSCLADQATNTYCYLEAVANLSPADLYVYSLPLGTQLPKNSTPSCSPCTKSVMGSFAQAAPTNPQLNLVYNGAATITNSACGQGFVSITSTSGGRMSHSSRGLG
ncbi:hypothetical protein BDW22DRAFT_1296956, partial [Trametopsis cervina]